MFSLCGVITDSATALAPPFKGFRLQPMLTSKKKNMAARKTIRPSRGLILLTLLFPNCSFLLWNQ
jgi:hypothetical protein